MISQEQKMCDLENFLQNEKNANTNGSWSKLSKSLKIKKMSDFSKLYQMEHHISDEEEHNLDSFLKDCISKNKIEKVKDLVYDKKTGKVLKINILTFNTQHNKFTLKCSDSSKRVSTLKHMGKRPISSSSISNDTISTISN